MTISVNTDCEVYPATLDDWQEIKDLYNHFQETKATVFIQAELPDLQSYLANSLTMPDKVGFVLLRYHGHLIGMASLCIVLNQQISEMGVQVVPQGFINAVYIRPSYTDGESCRTVPHEAGKMLCWGIEQWAALRNAEYVFGNVRTEKRNTGFVRKYGFRLMHQVIGKKIGDRDG